MKANYNCAQAELYTICRLAWGLCLDYLTDFSALKQRYTPQYVQDRLSSVEAASQRADFQARSERGETARIALLGQKEQCLKQFGFLKRYISSAYPSSLHKPKMEAAGINYYADAVNNNWEQLQAMLTSAVNFVQANEAELLAGDNMALGFAANLAQMSQDYDSFYDNFLVESRKIEIGTAEKIALNNSIYMELQDLLEDGKAIFSGNDTMYKQFTFSYLLQLTSGVATAGVKGYITDAATRRPIAGATVLLVEKDKVAMTEGDGRYEVLQVAGGKYTILVKAFGYVDYVKVEHLVKVGTVSMLNVELEAEV